MADNRDVVIVDDNGTEHIFPPGFDPKRAATIIKSKPMLPRETKLGRNGARLPLSVGKPDSVSALVRDYFQHFNSARLKEAADAYVAHLAKGGEMFLSMAGAGSTAELGKVLAPMIRAKKIHAMSVTGANLEEDLFLLVGDPHYQDLPDYHHHEPKDDQALGESGNPRVTDTTIPEAEAMQPVEEAARKVWTTAMRGDARLFPHEVLYTIIRNGDLETEYKGDPANSWLVAAAEADLPVFTPGWEDSTLGNVFAADCLQAKYDPTMIKYGVEAMMDLAQWYRQESKAHPMGFCQLGGGIPGDFAICVVPMLLADLHEKQTPLWSYFCQMTDADESMGGYSGALPNEKASWHKLGAETPAFNIKGDYTINFPLLASVVLGW